MNFLIYAAIAVIFFGIGWSVGVKNFPNMDKLSAALEKATEYAGTQGTPDVDGMNAILKANRDAEASSKIRILQNIADGNLEKAKEILINGLASDYVDILDDVSQAIGRQEGEYIVKQVENLAESYPVFQEVVNKYKTE